MKTKINDEKCEELLFGDEFKGTQIDFNFVSERTKRYGLAGLREYFMARYKRVKNGLSVLDFVEADNLYFLGTIEESKFLALINRSAKNFAILDKETTFVEAKGLAEDCGKSGKPFFRVGETICKKSTKVVTKPVISICVAKDLLEEAKLSLNSLINFKDAEGNLRDEASVKNELNNWIKPQSAEFQKFPSDAVFYLWHQAGAFDSSDIAQPTKEDLQSVY